MAQIKQRSPSQPVRTSITPSTSQSEIYKIICDVHTRTHLWLLGSSRSQKEKSQSDFIVPVLTLVPGARKDTNTEEFRYFKQTVTHEAVANILLPIKPFTKTPDIVQCPDQHFHCAIYGLSPHISDYLEQAGMTWILLNWCPMYVAFLLVYCLVHGLNSRRCHTPPHALDSPCCLRTVDHTAVLLSMHTDETL